MGNSDRNCERPLGPSQREENEGEYRMKLRGKSTENTDFKLPNGIENRRAYK